MKLTMNTTHLPTLKQMEAFVTGSQVLSWRCQDKTEAYRYIARVLRKLKYAQLTKPQKGTVRHYLMAVTGYQRAQLARLIAQYGKTGRLVPAARSQPHFVSKYTAEDIAELARIDDIHHGLSGPAMVHVLQREYLVFGNTACSRLQQLSVSHLYNLRKTTEYRQIRTHYTKTKPATIPIGERRKPVTDGRPGHLRVDSVHQGDKDGVKGVYHVNLVDEVTQWEVVVCVEGISERYMVPALIAAFQLFPFEILGFHSDNGSEYINQVVAKLLARLQVKLTKSRPRHSGDNGLVETKNGAVIRKALGYVHIPRTPENVARINRWYAAWFVPYLNFHRPCAFRKTTVNPRTGKVTHTYPKGDYQTPYEKLRSLPEAKVSFKADTSFALLDIQAYAMSDTQWAAHMQNNKAQLWGSLEF